MPNPDNVQIAPAEGKLGVLIPGMGAVTTTFIAGLEAQSNSARMSTAAANVLGMHTILVLRAERDRGWQGNLLVDRLLGAEVRFITTDDRATASTTMDRVLRETADDFDDLSGGTGRGLESREGRGCAPGRETLRESGPDHSVYR